MIAYAALLRAVNVGGTGKLAMADLKRLCDAAGFVGARTFIASGNALFSTAQDEAGVKAALSPLLASHMGKPVEVFVRSRAELDAVLATNPFPDAHPSRHLVYFFDDALPDEFMSQCRDVRGERLAVVGRELHVDYGDGIRFTKLKIPMPSGKTGMSISSVSRMAALMR